MMGNAHEEPRSPIRHDLLWPTSRDGHERRSRRDSSLKPATDPKPGQNMAVYLGLELPPDFFLRVAFSVETRRRICPALQFPISFSTGNASLSELPLFNDGHRFQFADNLLNAR